LSGPYPAMIFDLYKKCLANQEVLEGNKTEGAKLAEVMMLNCKGRIDSYIEPFIELAVLELTRAKRIELKITLVGVIANAIYYNPATTLQILEKRGWTKDAFNIWFQIVPKLARPHEKKLSILALSSLFSHPLSSLPHIVQLGLKQILEEIIKLGLNLDEQKKKNN